MKAMESYHIISQKYCSYYFSYLTSNIKFVAFSFRRNQRQLWKAGSLPVGWATFYRDTFLLDKSRQVLGLGYDPGVRMEDIGRAAVVHFDGIMKPWLGVGIDKCKHLWIKHVKYEHPYLQHCNLHT
ncbi:putative galacturonosyltransferase 5 [Salvia divinorum]|uniref:Hexosyltransferase n=1 Tax=Salvia divinorum TaxID=28513 RepID=A0ABD1G6I9_SALDI